MYHKLERVDFYSLQNKLERVDLYSPHNKLDRVDSQPQAFGLGNGEGDLSMTVRHFRTQVDPFRSRGLPMKKTRRFYVGGHTWVTSVQNRVYGAVGGSVL